MSERKIRDFYLRDAASQQEFLHYTWCNRCMAVDLGMTNPVEYELSGVVYIEGDCAVCGDKVTTEIQEDDEDDSN